MTNYAKRYEGTEGIIRTFGDKDIVTSPVLEVSKALYDLNGQTVWNSETMSVEERVAMVKQAAKNEQLDQFVLPHTITTNGMDRMNDTVMMSGAQLDNYKKNPIVAYGHWADMHVGNSKGLTVYDNSIVSKTWFHCLNEWSVEVAKLSLSGVMPMTSIGFIPLHWEDEALTTNERSSGDYYPSWSNTKRKYTKWELLEYSIVPIPANPSAGELKSLIGDASLGELVHKGISLGVITSDSPIAARITGKAVIVTDTPTEPTAVPEQKQQNQKVKSMNEELTAAVGALNTAFSQVLGALTNAKDAYDVGANEALSAVALGTIRLGNDMQIMSKDANVQGIGKATVKAATAIKTAAEAYLEGQSAEPAADPVEEPTGATDPVTLALDALNGITKAGAVLSAKNKTDLTTAKDLIIGVLAGAEPAEEGKSIDTETVSKSVYESDMKTLTFKLEEINAKLQPTTPKVKTLSEVLG